MSNLLEGLNPAQSKAVKHKDNPLLILAGPGSGKTRVITTKIAYLIKEMGVNPKSILAVTFTNKAAEEMRERATELSPEAKFSTITTFHSFCARMLRIYASFVGLTTDFSIYDVPDSVVLFRSVFPDFTQKEAKEIMKKISKFKNSDFKLKRSTMLNLSLDSTYYEKYQAALLQANAVDFDDLILHFTQILSTQEHVKERITSQYKYILVDEYQDSNSVQFELLKNLYAEGTYLSVVGDEDQSIYRFRGAEIENILNFTTAFKNVDTIKLEQNYRSTPNILNAASELIAKNTSRIGKTIWTERPSGKNVEVKYFRSNIDEVEFCARIASESAYKDTAILFRTNAQSFAFERGFTALGIPYKLVGGARFFEREEIKDMIAWMAIILNPFDVVAFRRVSNKPARGFGDVGQQNIIELADRENISIIEAIKIASDNGENKKHKSLAFYDLYNEFFEDIEDDETALNHFLLNIFTKTKLKDYYEKMDADEDLSKIDNVKEFIDFSAIYGNGREGLSDLLERIRLDAQFADEQEGNVDVVTLITIHNTKGLEFPKVIVSGLEEGIFPSSRSMESDDLEEERRLLYVAMTRAEKELYLTYCSNKNLWGTHRYFNKSIFVGELESVLGFEEETEIVEEHPYKKGQAVYQDDYGYGVIFKTEGEGENLIVFVQFETGFIGRFLPEYDSLELIESIY